MLREDILPAPMFGMYFKDGTSITMLIPRHVAIPQKRRASSCSPR